MTPDSGPQWPSRRWAVAWTVAIVIVLAPAIGPLVVFLLWHVLWIPAYFATKALGLQHGNWALLLGVWGVITLSVSLADNRRLGARGAWIRAALNVLARIALIEASAVTLCRIGERARGSEARSCYPHVAGWIATEHLRRRPAAQMVTP